MSDFVHREGSFSLFNNRKTKDSQPDMRGEGMLNGKPHEISAWKKQSQKGEWLSIVIQPKRELQQGSIKRPESKPEPKSFPRTEDDDSVPF
jgi:hypothetical protein